VIAALFRTPWRFGFFQAVRLLEHQARRERRAGTETPSGPVGLSSDPRIEAVRLRASTSLRFPASEVVAATPPQDGKAPELTVGFMSLAGAMGALPPPYAALLQGRAARSAFADFLDMFHSRLVGCFYAAWAKYRLPIAYERQDGSGTDDISRLLRALVGLELSSIANRQAIQDDLSVHYGGEFARLAKSAGGLERMLAAEFSLPVRIEQFVGTWIAIASDEQSRLSSDPLSRSPFAQLSRGAVLGAHIWDVEGTFRIILGPVGPEEFRRLLPSGPNLSRMRDLIRLYAPLHLRFTIRLLLRPDAVPEPRLTAGDDSIRLGWIGWLKDERSFDTMAEVELSGEI
jgi:type VI secretion system protein ImpH